MRVVHCFPVNIRTHSHSVRAPHPNGASSTAYLSAVVQLEHSQGGRHDEALLLVVRRWNALEHTKSAQTLLASRRLVRQHASHGSPEDLARRSEVVRAVVRVHVTSLAQEVQVFHCGREKLLD